MVGLIWKISIRQLKGRDLLSFQLAALWLAGPSASSERRRVDNGSPLLLLGVRDPRQNN
jgi:hypothetical protein